MIMLHWSRSDIAYEQPHGSGLQSYFAFGTVWILDAVIEQIDPSDNSSSLCLGGMWFEYLQAHLRPIHT